MSEKKKTPIKIYDYLSLTASEGNDLPEDTYFDNDQVENPDYCQWDCRDKGIFIPINRPKIVKKIPSGYYKIEFSDKIGYFLTSKEITSDDVFELPLEESKLILDDIENFWKNKNNYKKYKLLHKRGIILSGIPGGGKTSAVNILIKKLKNEQGGIVFSIEDESDLVRYKDFMSSVFRKIEPDRPIITIIEDIDGLLDNGRSCEKMLLNILDGINQIEGVVYIATTNFPERMEERLLNRPSRFDRRYVIGYPSAKVRKAYFENKFLADDSKKSMLKEMVKLTNNLTIAHLKEIFASVIIMGNDLVETVNIMKDMSKLPSSRDDKGSNVGFGKKEISDEDDFNKINWDDEF